MSKFPVEISISFTKLQNKTFLSFRKLFVSGVSASLFVCVLVRARACKFARERYLVARINTKLILLIRRPICFSLHHVCSHTLNQYDLIRIPRPI